MTSKTEPRGKTGRETTSTPMPAALSHRSDTSPTSSGVLHIDLLPTADWNTRQTIDMTMRIAQGLPISDAYPSKGDLTVDSPASSPEIPGATPRIALSPEDNRLMNDYLRIVEAQGAGDLVKRLLDDGVKDFVSGPNTARLSKDILRRLSSKPGVTAKDFSNRLRFNALSLFKTHWQAVGFHTSCFPCGFVLNRLCRTVVGRQWHQTSHIPMLN